MSAPADFAGHNILSARGSEGSLNDLNDRAGFEGVVHMGGARGPRLFFANVHEMLISFRLSFRSFGDRSERKVLIAKGLRTI
jgi:hypothetical protein